MAKFVRVGSKYINLDHVSHVTIDEKTLAVCYKDHQGQALTAYCDKKDPEHQELLMALEDINL